VASRRWACRAAVMGRAAGLQQKVAGGRRAKKVSIWPCLKRLRSQTRPGRSETVISKTVLARSTAIVVCFSRDSSFRELLCDSTPRWHPDAVHAVGGVHLITSADSLRSAARAAELHGVGRHQEMRLSASLVAQAILALFLKS